MTTAARPTFEPAKGGKRKGENDRSSLSKQYSSKDLLGHTRLKYRQQGQNSVEEVRSRDLRHELQEKEKESKKKKSREKRSFTEAPSIQSGGGSAGGTHSGRSAHKRQKVEPPPNSIDADDVVNKEDVDDDDEDDSDEDDTAELLRELQRIKQERAKEQTQREKERKEEQERVRTEYLLKGNLLLNQSQSGGGFKIKKKWDNNVIFKNRAKAEPQSTDKHFINDTIRSEFHWKFMDKYVK